MLLREWQGLGNRKETPVHTEPRMNLRSRSEYVCVQGFYGRTSVYVVACLCYDELGVSLTGKTIPNGSSFAKY